MRLYYSQGACSRTIRIVTYELGIACEFEAVNLKTKRTEQGTDFLTLNPKGTVPALLLDNGEVLTENTAILQYLVETQQNNALLPATGIERYRVLEWLSYISTDLHKSCGPLFSSAMSNDLKENYFKPIVEKHLSFINRALEQKSHLTTIGFSLADSYLFVVLSWLPHLGFTLDNWPALLEYHQRILVRDSVQKAIEAERRHA